MEVITNNESNVLNSPCNKRDSTGERNEKTMHENEVIFVINMRFFKNIFHKRYEKPHPFKI